MNGWALRPERRIDDMPKVLISVAERVFYAREVEMTEAEFRQWDAATDKRGKEGQDAVDALVEKYINRAEHWQEADKLSLMDLSVVLNEPA
jgi:CHASE1-domain containing sensor protein